MKKIFVFIICLSLFPGNSIAQQPGRPESPAPAFRSNPAEADTVDFNYLDTIPVYVRMKGLRLGLDVSQIANSFMNTGQSGLSASVDFEYRDNMYLVAELGYTRYELEKTDPSLSYLYTASGSFLKLGFDYNLGKASNPYHKDMVFIGMRLAGSSYSHEINQVVMREGYWDSEITGNVPSLSETALWTEVVFGAKAELFKNFFIGTSIAGRFKLYGSKSDMLGSQHIPGYGKGYKGFNFSAAVSLYYTLPIWKQHKTFLKDVEQ